MYTATGIYHVGHPIECFASFKFVCLVKHITSTDVGDENIAEHVDDVGKDFTSVLSDQSDSQCSTATLDDDTVPSCSYEYLPSSCSADNVSTEYNTDEDLAENDGHIPSDELSSSVNAIREEVTVETEAHSEACFEKCASNQSSSDTFIPQSQAPTNPKMSTSSNIDLDSPLYPGAPVTLHATLILILAFVLSHNITKDALADLLSLLNMVLLGKLTSLLDHRLLAIKPVNEISRTPRAHTDRKHWSL